MRLFIVPALSCLVALTSVAQHGQVAAGIEAARLSGAVFPSRPLFQPVQRSMVTDQRWNSAVSEASVIALDPSATASLLAEVPETFSLELSGPEGAIVLDLERANIFTEDFSVVQASDNIAASVELGLHYRGTVRGVAGSLAAISVYNNEVMGLVSDADGDHVLGRLNDGTDGLHVFYREADLLAPHAATCGTADIGDPVDPSVLFPDGAVKTTKCVRLYWEVNYDIFQGKGSVANATSYVTGLFNQMATLYDNDGVDVLLSQVFVWDVPSPYTHADTGDQLDQFGITRTSFNGDLAHLLGYTGGGGIAWRETLCSSTPFRMAYSDINSTYQNVPTYSWSVEVVTHETGHNLGSRHTHACSWNGNNTAIDGCGPVAGYTEGNCAQGPLPDPSVGGTIMSYCHLTSSTIKFANGFGPQPTAYIVNEVNTAGCLTTCASLCDIPTGLAAGSITTTSAVISWSAAAGAVTYTLQWKVTGATGWNTVSGINGTSHALSGLAAGTSYTTRVLSVCSSVSSANTPSISFTTTAVATCAVPTNPAAGSITSSSAVITWNAVSGAVTYRLQWKLASASTWTTVNNIPGTTHTLSGLAANTAYNFRVRTNCASTNSANTATVVFNTTAAGGCSDPGEPNDTQATANVVTPNVTLARVMGSSTDLDWFRFSNSSTQRNIRVRLTNLPADYNVRLYNGNTQVGISNLSGTANETIILNNAPISSTYYVRVNGAGGVFNPSLCYSVIIEISSTAFSMPEGLVEGAATSADIGDGVTVFPNPANDMVAIYLPAYSGAAIVELLDALGHVVRTELLGSDASGSQLQFSVADRNEGLYLVRVTMEDATITKRLIIAH